MFPLESNPADQNPYASPLPPEGWLLPPSIPFDDYCNSRQAIHIIWALVTFIGVPLAVTLAALYLQLWNGRWTDPRGFTVLLVAWGTTVALQLVLANYCYTYGADVVQLLQSRFQAEGIDPTAWNGICVTFSPADRPRQFMKGSGSHSVHDAGFLFLFDDVLLFLGEKTSFALPRQVIRGVRAGEGVREMGWFPPRAYIDWVDPQSQSVQTFNFGATGAYSMYDARFRVAPELLDKLSSWLKGFPVGVRGTAGFANLGLPKVELAAAAVPHAQSRNMMLSGFGYTAAIAGAVELGVAWLTGQPFTGCVPLACLLSLVFLCSPMIITSDPPA